MLRLSANDQIAVFVEEVIPMGAGLTHSSFCVTLLHVISDGNQNKMSKNDPCMLTQYLETPAAAYCGLAQEPGNSMGVMSYDDMFTRVDQFYFGGLDLQTGVFKAPKTGTYLVNFDTQVDSGAGPRSPEGYYSAYIRCVC